MDCSIRPSNVRVYQFHHDGKERKTRAGQRPGGEIYIKEKQPGEGTSPLGDRIYLTGAGAFRGSGAAVAGIC